MRKGFILFITLIFLGIGCKTDTPPKNILAPEKMQSVLSDILLAESFAESYLAVDTTKKLKQLYAQELDKVMAVHKISQKEFRISMNYYKTRPDLLKVIMDTVNNRAIREKDKMFKEVTEKKYAPKTKKSK